MISIKKIISIKELEARQQSFSDFFDTGMELTINCGGSSGVTREGFNGLPKLLRFV